MKGNLKREWHKKMKARACQYAGEKCQNCHKSTRVSSGVIHHLEYPAGVYEKDVEELIDDEICVWLCRECHLQIHLAHSLEESQQHLKNGGHCQYCKKLVFGGWDRAKTLGLDYCICKGCYKAIKAIEKQKSTGQLTLF